MQPQYFLKAINGQTVDSYLCFFLSEREGGWTCVSLTQNCSDVGARCVLAFNVLSPYNCCQHVGWHRDSQIAAWV